MATTTILCVFLFIVVATAKNNTNHLTSFSVANSPWFPSANITLLSPQNHTFAAGFRRSVSSPSLYIFAVWVRRPRTIIWSLNPDNPVSASTPLVINPNGTLSLLNLFNPMPFSPPETATLSLNDYGNLVFGNWSSFAYPTDTIMCNQPIPPNGTTLKSGQYQFVNATSLVFNNSDSYWSVDQRLLNLTSDGHLNNFVMADVNQTTVLRRLTLDSDGNLRVYSLNTTTGSWLVSWQAIIELCSIRGTCGVNEICMPNGNATACDCTPGFRRTTNGCERKLPSTNMFHGPYVMILPSSQAPMYFKKS